MNTGSAVSLVIPGRNCAATIAECLGAVVPLLDDPQSPLGEIIFVDDGSTDDTASIAREFPVAVIDGLGDGPGAARNLGWRAATSNLVWFVDADCIAEPDALPPLLAAIDAPDVAAAGGGYGIADDGTLLARLIHEEIVERHRRMAAAGRDIDFLATFNVVYRREVLEALGGFDERYRKAQDAELGFRACEAGHRLRFVPGSIVRHHHEARWGRYLRTQYQQGYWRVWLHLERRGHAVRNSYSNAIDHLQPPLGVLAIASCAMLPVPVARWTPVVLAALLVAMQVPMTVALVRRCGPAYLAIAFMGAIRALWRGVGMVHGTIRYVLRRR
jgi:glycosyltransferase involved in cell wall biosynthesis